MIPVTVVQMPLLNPGITCRYCGHPINDDVVFSVEGTNYRCAKCADELITKIQELRNGNNEVCKAGMQ